MLSWPKQHLPGLPAGNIVHYITDISGILMTRRRRKTENQELKPKNPSFHLERVKIPSISAKLRILNCAWLFKLCFI